MKSEKSTVLLVDFFRSIVPRADPKINCNFFTEKPKKILQINILFEINYSRLICFVLKSNYPADH